ncbi:MAG: class I SAM-dependent methyltransferase [Alphaproteobacteria bacterium]|nr:class I SAM-dependent methyltransferase [Alphaproteobacteria bacterium]
MPAPGATAVARAHAVYTPLNLYFYDLLVHGLSNHLAWRCPTRRLSALYEANLSGNHLEAGVGTGFFLDHTGEGRIGRLVLLDINRHCLDCAARRLARFNPTLVQANLLAPIATSLAPFDSVSLTYVLHCLPGRMHEKLATLDYLRPLMNEKAVLYGATILGRGITPNLAARRLLALYNAKGVFNNYEDDLESLTAGLRQRFGHVAIETQGCVALFRAS